MHIYVTMADILFVSMGMFIIDEIEYLDGSVLRDVIGGAGTYGAYGARYFLPGDEARRVGWVVDAGSDFPETLRKQLLELNTSMLLREDASRLTTRGWNGYGANEYRAFKYQTPKKRITTEDIIGTELITSRSFHLICAPERCQDLIDGLNAARADQKLPPAIIAWEPVPELCTPEYLDACFSSLPHVDILTPNSAEAAAFFGLEEPTEKAGVEALAQKFFAHMRDDAAVVIRAGADGCVILSKATGMKWLEAYHAPWPERVIDPTGAGNSFVGGMCIGYTLHGRDIVEAALYGNLAAGLAIEQVGVAKPTYPDGSSTVEELWNGTSVFGRMAEYKRRLGL
ncbi:Ribokinase-like protein [Limtongia smithiae]|uniref:Ribokinase-like protein n=1 Tax=Limtongia smithiae TaxID=1125753 RepID=UPI0034CF9BA9